MTYRDFNWTGRGILIPRSAIETLDVEEMHVPGIYLLVGTQREQGGTPPVEIHLSGDLFETVSAPAFVQMPWNQVIVSTTSPMISRSRNGATC